MFRLDELTFNQLMKESHAYEFRAARSKKHMQTCNYQRVAVYKFVGAFQIGL